MTGLIDIPVIKNLRLTNVNRQLQDLIKQCGAISKLINDTVSKHQSMSSSSDKQIYPNSKLQTQVKPRKFMKPISYRVKERHHHSIHLKKKRHL